MQETGMRGGYQGTTFFPFINTTAKCLRFAYAFYGTGPAQLKVFSRNLVLEDTELLHLETTGEETFRGSWKYHFTRLADGLNRVMFTGIRGETGVNGMGIDDIEISPCSHFEALRDCYSDIMGKTYAGFTNTSAYEEGCLDWRSEASPGVVQGGTFIDGSIEDANAFCRNPTGEYSSTWCYVNSEERKKCSIPFCGTIFICSS
jgi:hypothetical protein